MTKQRQLGVTMTGWLIQCGQRYYTGNPRSPLESWTPFPQLAKVYKRQRWAHTMATRLGGQVVPVKSQDTLSNG